MKKNRQFIVTILIGVGALFFLFYFVAPVVLLTAHLWWPGEKEAVPSFLRELPLFPGAEVIKEGGSGALGQEDSLWLKAPPSSSQNDVLAFYTDELKARGWALKNGDRDRFRKGGKRMQVDARACIQRETQAMFFTKGAEVCNEEKYGEMFRQIRLIVTRL